MKKTIEQRVYDEMEAHPNLFSGDKLQVIMNTARFAYVQALYDLLYETNNANNKITSIVLGQALGHEAINKIKVCTDATK